jgi:thimet oligopeptidase
VKVIALLAGAFAAATAVAATPVRPLVRLYDPPTVTRLCEEGIARAKASIGRMAAGKTGAGFFGEWDRLQIEMEDVVNPIYLMGNVHPDKAVRDAAEPCLREYTTLSTELFQDERIFARVNAAKPANPRQAKLRKDLVEGFEDAGVSLPAQKRRRAREIFDRLEDLRQAFDRNLRDERASVVMSPAELEGMPDAYRAAQRRNAAGDYVLGLDYPSYVPFMAGARSEAARRRYYIAKASEGGEGNARILDETFLLRQELAGLHGMPSYAHYSLRRKMAGKPANVSKFLEEVRSAVAEPEKAELEQLRAEKAAQTGRPLAETALGRWDIAYYEERIRRSRFSVDQEQLRGYFPTGKALEYVLRVAQTVCGVKFREARVPVWHADVRYFDVFEAASGRRLAGFYLDLYPREGKHNHAAAFPVRGASRLAARTPLSALVANFNRQGLEPRELETLLHEFGHVLHGVLSRTDYNSHAGTSTTIDFVEAPSQMFEAWAHREQPLALFAKVCPECPPLAKEAVARLEAARRFGAGIRYARQWLLAAFDMELSTHPQPALALWKRMESATPSGHVEGTMFPASFSHIAGHYAAGYYGYLWSEMLALDMLSVFGDNLLDPGVGHRYRETILSQGGQQEPAAMVRRFLGREPSGKAFFAEIAASR